jgi:phosphonate degradation associated HDIG domain protein
VYWVHPTTQSILRLFKEKGDSQYGREAVTQLQHGLQAARLAEMQGASAELITAALLHDVGHLLHDLPQDAPEHGVDDRHEVLGERFLRKHFSAAVVEPVRMHVDAKRYLCAVEPTYRAGLSAPSEQSLLLQGGPMDPSEIAAFEASEFCPDAVLLRRWDDLAKDASLVTPEIEHFAPMLDLAARAFDAAQPPGKPA